MTSFWIALGVAVGVLLTIPAAAVWSRRTERRVRTLEQRARSAERLAELGTMTGGLAHEIKNPLSTINLNTQLLQEDLADLSRSEGVNAQAIDPIRRRLESVARETQRLREILEDFLRFAGRIKLDLQEADVNAIVDDLAAFIEPQAHASGVRVRLQLSAVPSVARVDPSLLKQALLNLVINAIQAMEQCRSVQPGKPATPHGGATDLILRTENARVLDRDELHIHVIDTGPGIPPQVMDKIFQPYFTTKKSGTGLGLPTTRRIIEEHAGHLAAHSTPGTGTDFVVTLPQQRDASQT
jgi:signal transduction histidine kinase